jgi:hypothetical protein
MLNLIYLFLSKTGNGQFYILYTYSRIKDVKSYFVFNSIVFFHFFVLTVNFHSMTCLFKRIESTDTDQVSIRKWDITWPI